MAEYLPILTPGQAITLKASAAVTGGQVVEITGSGTVGPAGDGSTKAVGVAGFDVALNGDVVIYAGGVQHCTASGAITAGDQVATATGGKIAKGTSGVIGVAITDAQDGADVRVQFNR